MKNLRRWSFSVGTLIAYAISMAAYAQQTSTFQTSSTPVSQPSYSQFSNTQALRIGIVNTKKCLEESKLGKQEQANFDKMKQQMESVLQEKEKSLEEIENRLNDDDEMDSLSDDKVAELKRKRRSIRNDGMQLQNQYIQTLQQANLKIVQKLTEAITKASSQIAQDPSQGIDIIFTDEACTYFAPRFDVSDRIIAKMNAFFDSEQKESSAKSR